jgi:hypothetical protein
MESSAYLTRKLRQSKSFFNLISILIDIAEKNYQYCHRLLLDTGNQQVACLDEMFILKLHGCKSMKISSLLSRSWVRIFLPGILKNLKQALNEAKTIFLTANYRLPVISLQVAAQYKIPEFKENVMRM